MARVRTNYYYVLTTSVTLWEQRRTAFDYHSLCLSGCDRLIQCSELGLPSRVFAAVNDQTSCLICPFPFPSVITHYQASFFDEVDDDCHSGSVTHVEAVNIPSWKPPLKASDYIYYLVDCVKFARVRGKYSRIKVVLLPLFLQTEYSWLHRQIQMLLYVWRHTRYSRIVIC